MEQIDKALEILIAFKLGKRVEYLFNGNWYGVANADIILDRLSTDPTTLRVAKEKKYRPYANAEEFLNDSKEHGPYILRKGYGGCYCLAVGIPDEGVVFADSEEVYTFERLFNEYKWHDGSLCGILEN